MLQAGFAETDITPPSGTDKVGWIKRIVGDRILDPLCARAALLDNGHRRVGLVSLDTLSIRWTQVEEIRRRAAARGLVTADHLLVAATHNHAGPAVFGTVDTPRDEAYTAWLTARVVELLARAAAALQPAHLAFARGLEFDIARNRRILYRDGIVRTHGSFRDPLALCYEGPIDPELAVLAARTPAGQPLGCLVNFACHPTHHGGSTEFSGGYPGVLAREMQARGWPVTLFLNGACGNLHHANPENPALDKSKEEIGARLADDTVALLTTAAWRDTAELAAARHTVQLPYRQVDESEVRGTVRGAQRFVDPTAYDRAMPALLERIRRRGTQPAEVQVLRVDEVSLAGIPAEFFVENGLRIKAAAHPRHALVVSHANGMVGYVPHPEAFAHGGYETTFGPGNRLAPEAAPVLIAAAADLIRST